MATSRRPAAPGVPRLRRPGPIVALAGVTLVLAGCAAGPAGPAAPGAPDEGHAVAIDHVHELAVDPADGTLLAATHSGVLRLDVAGGTATADGPLGGHDFDPMGFAVADGVWYASGHPGPASPPHFGSPHLGLISSVDAGSEWRNVSLTGEVDFHGLTATSDGTTVIGYDGSAVRASSDGGATWSTGAPLVVGDLLAVGDRVLVTTPDGLLVSDDDGVTFAAVPAAPPLVLLAADPDGVVVGVDTAGTVWTGDAGTDGVPGSWVRTGAVEEAPTALAVAAGRLYAADGRGLVVSDDRGGTWTVLDLLG